MYMECTRVWVDKVPLNKIIKKQKRFDGGQLTYSDAVRYAVQKLVDELTTKVKDGNRNHNDSSTN